MIKNKPLILSLLFLSFLSFSHNIDINQYVNQVYVNDGGELICQKEECSYKSWNSAQLTGKVHVIQHIAGRTKAKDMNAPLIEAIKGAGLPREYYQTTTIVNVNDTIFGTSMFVRRNIESSKRQFPWSQFIVDNRGVVKGAWDLSSEGSAIIVLDKKGKVQFAKDGALTPAEVKLVISKLHQLVEQ